MQKIRQIFWSATVVLIGIFLVLSGFYWYGTSQPVAAQDNASTTIYFPIIACSDCSAIAPTITPTASPTATPTATASPTPTATPTLSPLQPSLTAMYAVTVTNDVLFGAANIISGTNNATDANAANAIQATANVSLPLYLDLYEPVNAPAGKRPVVMWMFGSGFTNLAANRKGGFVPIAQELAARGYVVVSIDYRTAYLNPVVSAQAKPYLDQIVAPVDNSWVPFVFTPPLFPSTLTEDQYERAIAAAYDDGLTALNWIASQAEALQLDMDRVALMGSSSGTTTENALAYLSDDIGVTTPKIAAMLHLWGGMDYSRADGLTEIEADEAELFMIHSIGDTAIQGGVDYINAKEMGERAAAIGLPYELLTLMPDPEGITPALQAGTGHGLTQVPILEALSDNGQTLFQRLVNFLHNAIDERQVTPELTATYSVTVTDGIQFGAANLISGSVHISLPLALDLYEPVNAPAGKRPVVMWMFGSGFTNLAANRKGGFVPIAQELAARGYVVVSIDYRTAYLDPVVSAQAKPYFDQIIEPVDNSWVPFVFTPPLFPSTLTEDQYERAIAAAYDDGLTALKWLSGQANGRQLDMNRVALMGSSSGTTTENSLAYLSDDIGITTPKIAAMLHLWGGMDYSRGDGLTEIEADEADLFMIHSIGDTATQGGVDYINAKEMGERAAAIGLPYELLTLMPDPNGITPALQAGTGHGLTQVPILQALSDNGQTLFQRLVNFLNGALPE